MTDEEFLKTIPDSVERVLGTKQGRDLFFYLIYNEGGLRGLSASPDTHMMAFKEGKRAMAMAIRTLAFRHAPDLAILMEQEALQRARLEEEPQRKVKTNA